ncbi:MAG TPA: hypothetical protein DCE41_12620 [Cytophagales bacterium]|nr:hypothetical protein [Cytophagales bacterium]HAA24432.1 hypothetical protein [Cytophagales bacterium]HAP59666.1 hypothetical protein [Cytophagales bacterium]
MARLVMRQAAIDDLTDIWEYLLETWSEAQADKYYEMIKLACQEIAQNPSLGRAYPEISHNVRGYDRAIAC